MEYYAALGMSLFQAVHGWVLQRPCFIPPTFGEDESLKKNFLDGALWKKTDS